MATLEDLGGHKSPGLLLRSDDWNAIVDEVVRLEEDKADVTRVEALEEAVLDPEEGLVAQVAQLATAVTTLQSRVDALEAIRDRYVQVSLATQQLTFALGTRALLTATLTDLEGGALQIPNAAERPWVDFVTTWGTLSAAPGFNSRGGAGQRTLSVQTDANGVAQARLGSETVRGLSAEDESRMEAALLIDLPGNTTLADIITGATAPSEAQERGAYRMMRQEYDAVGSGGIKAYMDATYEYQFERQPNFGLELTRNSFVDYHATVLALAKPDRDPLTPDHAMGVGTIQVTFRDWIWSWAWNDYFVATEPLVQGFRGEIDEIFTDEPDFEVAAGRFGSFYNDALAGRGILERERNLQALMGVLEDVTLPGNQARYLPLVQGSRDALGLQLALERGRGESGAVRGVDPVLRNAARGEQALGGLEQRVVAQESRAAGIESTVQGIEGQVASLGGQFEAMTAEGGSLTVALQRVGNLDQQLQDLNAEILSPTETRVTEIDGRVLQALERIALLENR